MNRATLTSVLSGILLSACASSRRNLPADGAMPAWLRAIVFKDPQWPYEVESCTYNTQPVFELIATDRYDTGDEHIVYSAEGKFICQFGGYAPEVTRGSCAIDRIIYVSTLYDPPRR